MTLQWHHNELNGVSNHQRLYCLLNRLFRRRSKKISQLRDTGLCEGNSPVTSEFLAQRASNAEKVSISWHHHQLKCRYILWFSTWRIWLNCQYDGMEFFHIEPHLIGYLCIFNTLCSEFISDNIKIILYFLIIHVLSFLNTEMAWVRESLPPRIQGTFYPT